MLLWEALCSGTKAANAHVSEENRKPHRGIRLPYDHRCAAMTKSGKRCRGKILPGTEFCLFHDPAVAEKRRRGLTSSDPRRRALLHLPDGYLRRLTSRAAVGQAMDRLYREVRLGIVTPEMGNVLFSVLTRVLDSGLCDLRRAPKRPAQSKAERMRPKLADLLTQAERAAWRKAVAHAPAPPRLLLQPGQPFAAAPIRVEAQIQQQAAEPARLVS